MRYVSGLNFFVGAALLCGFSLSFAAAADTVKAGGTGSALGSIKHLSAAFEQLHPNKKIVAIEGLGSSGSIKAVAAGAIDISFSARPLKPAERELHLKEQEIARTPLVLASMRKHSHFTVTDLPKIYDGSLSVWPDNMPLRPILRPDSDAESALLRAISPELDKALSAAHKRPGVHTAITDQDSANAIENIPGAVGTSTLALIISERRKLHALPLNGVMPSVQNLARGHYPYYKPLYLVTPEHLSDSSRAFIAFILSSAGTKILSDNGYLVLP